MDNASRSAVRLPEPARIDIPSGTALVWTISARLVRPELLGVLSEDERTVANALYASARCRFVIGRASLRTILAERLFMRPESVPIQFTPNGKPFVEASGVLEFSVSHAGDWVAIALTTDRPIGIDIECIRMDVPVIPLAARFGPSGFADRLASKSPDEAAILYWTWWVSQEAALKACGERLTKLLSGSIARGVDIMPLPAPAGYVAALATSRS